MHIGLIGGIGPAATEFYYRGLVKAHTKLGKRMELTIVHADTREMISNLENGCAKKQATIFEKFVDRLRAAGAGAVAVTSLGGHFCIKELEAISSLPVINAIPILDNYFGNMEIKRVGLLGTRMVMESKLYGGISSVETMGPKEGDLDVVHKNYIDIALSGVVTESQIDFFKETARKLCEEQGADVVALAGTDLFVAFEKIQSEHIVVDCAEIHIEAITEVSISS